MTARSSITKVCAVAGSRCRRCLRRRAHGAARPPYRGCAPWGVSGRRDADALRHSPVVGRHTDPLPQGDRTAGFPGCRNGDAEPSVGPHLCATAKASSWPKMAPLSKARFGDPASPIPTDSARSRSHDIRSRPDAVACGAPFGREGGLCFCHPAGTGMAAERWVYSPIPAGRQMPRVRSQARHPELARLPARRCCRGACRCALA